MRIQSAGDLFLIWFWTLIGLAVANYLFLLLAYDWRTYAVLGTLSVLCYLATRTRRGGRSASIGRAVERTPYDHGGRRLSRRERWQDE